MTISEHKREPNMENPGLSKHWRFENHQMLSVCILYKAKSNRFAKEASFVLSNKRELNIDRSNLQAGKEERKGKKRRKKQRRFRMLFTNNIYSYFEQTTVLYPTNNEWVKLNY